MTHLAIAPGLRSKERNTELALLVASVAFIWLAWKALVDAHFVMPPGWVRIEAQFVAIAVLGHLGLRIVAPKAAPQPFAIAMLLTAIGLAFVTRVAPAVAQKQVHWATLGVASMVVAARFGRDYSRLRSFKYTAAAVSLALLFLTGIFGTTIYGARLWITIAGQTVQTTEFIKLFLIVFLAGYLADEAGVLSSPRIRFGGREYSALPYLLPLVIAWGVTMLAIGLLRDLGNIMLLMMLAVGALYLATGRLRFVFGGIALLCVALVLGYLAFGHVRTRIDVWLNPHEDARGTGYQSLQSIYAIQAGGITGEGLGLGQPDKIPVVPTDYIFSAIGEELGLAGALGVVLLYVAFLFAGFRIAVWKADDYGSLLAACIALLIAVQASVIIAGNLRLIPTTGITLPFVSYGGSSLVVNFALVGLLLGISQSGTDQR